MSGLIPKYGGYRKLKSFQVAQLVYDCTVAFCDRYIDRKSRTHDQMVQAARSGVQNIAEGSAASGTSKKIELKLTNVARASLEELLLDYEDFLRQRALSVWPGDDPRVQRIRNSQVKSIDELRKLLSDSSVWGGAPRYSKEQLRQERGANAVICLIQQASYLLGRQIKYLEKNFLEEGGFTERMYQHRRQKKSDASDLSDASDN
jgi:four helix bundle suffix protein